MQDRAKAEYAGEYRDQDYTVQVLPSAAPAPRDEQGAGRAPDRFRGVIRAIMATIAHH
jgi:hypothetical protein